MNEIKENIKKKTFSEKQFHVKSFLYGILATLFGIFALTLLGFKFVYAPCLENNWDAIGSAGTWATGIASALITTYIFIRQNNFEARITEREERIALFDKRYLIYTQAENMLTTVDSLNSTCSDPFSEFAKQALDVQDNLETEPQTADFLMWIKYNNKLEDKISIIKQSQFCFSEESIYQTLLDFAETYRNLVEEILLRSLPGKANKNSKALQLECELKNKTSDVNVVLDQMRNHLKLELPPSKRKQ